MWIYFNRSGKKCSLTIITKIRSQELVAKIDSFVAHYNGKSRPFSWTATAASILEKLHRLLNSISGTRH